MIDKSLFDAQIERLETWDTAYQISKEMRVMWHKELEGIQVSNDDFKAGIDYIFANPGQFRKRPALPELLECCGNAKFARWEKEERDKKLEHEKMNYRKLSSATEHGLRSLKLIKLMLTTELTPRQKIDYMLKMEEFYPGNGWRGEAMKLARELGIN